MRQRWGNCNYHFPSKKRTGAQQTIVCRKFKIRISKCYKVPYIRGGKLCDWALTVLPVFLVCSSRSRTPHSGMSFLLPCPPCSLLKETLEICYWAKFSAWFLLKKSWRLRVLLKLVPVLFSQDLRHLHLYNSLKIFVGFLWTCLDTLHLDT